MKINLTDVRKLIEKLAEQIQAPQYLLPTYGNTLEGTHVELDRAGLLYFFATERGKENFRYLAKDVDDLLYKIFEGATLTMASNYELKNRIKGQDFRRVMFNEQERLLGVLNKEWTQRRITEVEEILTKNPFDDNASERVSYYQLLVQAGKHVGNEWFIASEKYPPINKSCE